MAFSAVTERGSASERSLDSALSMSPSANITVGKIAFIYAPWDNSALADGASTTHDTLTDTDGNIWNKVFERTRTAAGAVRDGVTHSLFWALVATQIDTGDTITLTADNADAQSKVLMCFEVTVGAGNTIQVAGTPQFLEVASTDPAALTISGLSSKEYLFLGFMAAEDEFVGWTESSSDAFTNVFAAEGVTSGPAGGAATNVIGFIGYRIATGTGATFDVAYPGGTGTPDMALALVAFEEVTGGTNHTATQTDPEGLVDSITRVADYAPAKTDPEGLVDTVGQVTDSVRSQTDSLGLTDDATYQISSGTEQTKTDPLGLVDSVAQVADQLRDVTDPEGLVDTVGQEQGHAREITDNLGLVDDGEWIAVGSDAVGILDTVTVAADYLRTVDDTVGLTDSVSYDLTSGGVAHTATIIDTLGLVDGATAALTMSVTVSDSLGLSDTASYLAGYNPTVTDLLGLTDSETHSGDMVRDVIDLLGLLDDIATQLTGAGFWTPDPAGYTANPAAYVPVGPDDTPPPW